MVYIKRFISFAHIKCTFIKKPVISVNGDDINQGCHWIMAVAMSEMKVEY